MSDREFRPGDRVVATRPENPNGVPRWVSTMDYEPSVLTVKDTNGFLLYVEENYYAYSPDWLRHVPEPAPKPLITTLPPEALRDLVDQFTYGAGKSDPGSGKTYGQFGWRETEDAVRKYKDAAFRHHLALLLGETHDADGRSHAIALAANGLILHDLLLALGKESG